MKKARLCLALFLVCTSGCLWRTFSELLPGTGKDKGTAKAPSSGCPKPERHCVDLEPGNASSAVCLHCGAACNNFDDNATQSKPPVPVPIPDCNPERHCTAKETCKVIGGDCCATCHQGCFPLSSSE